MRRLATLAAAGSLLAACAGPSGLDLRAVTDGIAPPPDAVLADADWPDTAAWIVDEVDRSGRPVIVKFFAAWCLPCREEAPVLLDAMAAHPEVAVLGVDHEDTRGAAEDWIVEYGFDAFPTVFDVEGQAARVLGARGMPAVAFIDRTGRLVGSHTGPIDPALLEEWIDHLAHDGPRPSDRASGP